MLHIQLISWVQVYRENKQTNRETLIEKQTKIKSVNHNLCLFLCHFMHTRVYSIQTHTHSHIQMVTNVSARRVHAVLVPLPSPCAPLFPFRGFSPLTSSRKGMCCPLDNLPPTYWVIRVISENDGEYLHPKGGGG